MKFATIAASLCLLVFEFAAALPTSPATGKVTIAQPFYITTSPQKAYAPVKQLPHANATSLFDPNSQATYQLRLIAPGYSKPFPPSFSHQTKLTMRKTPSLNSTSPLASCTQRPKYPIASPQLCTTQRTPMQVPSLALWTSRSRMAICRS